MFTLIDLTISNWEILTFRIMDYKRLKIEARFLRWRNSVSGDKDWYSTSFKEKYERDAFHFRPQFNPLSDITFYSDKKIIDIYNLVHVLMVDRGFLISSRFRKILEDFNLCQHVVFEGIRCIHRGKVSLDLSFIYFYEDFGSSVDFMKSKFWLVKPQFGRVGGKIEDEDIIEKEVQVNSLVDYQAKSKMYRVNYGGKLYIDEICCPEAMKYDVFTLMAGPWNQGVYFSPRLQQRIITENIIGVRYAQNQYFNFKCV